MYLNIDWNSTLVSNANADAVYNGAATSTVILHSGTTIQTEVWQDYLLPQYVGGIMPLPQLDLLTVYELNGTIKSTDNLAAGVEKLIDYPNVRSVIGAYFNFVNNGIMNAGSDISQIRLRVNGNNILYEGTADSHLFEMRNMLNSDLRNGMYFMLSRQKPIETAYYGNVQLGVTPSSVTTGNTHFDIAWESFYTKGMTLPGMSQASG